MVFQNSVLFSLPSYFALSVIIKFHWGLKCGLIEAHAKITSNAPVLFECYLFPLCLIVYLDESNVLKPRKSNFIRRLISPIFHRRGERTLLYSDPLFIALYRKVVPILYLKELNLVVNLSSSNSDRVCIMYDGYIVNIPSISKKFCKIKILILYVIFPSWVVITLYIII